MTDHILGDHDIVVQLAVMHLKQHPDKVRQDRRAAGLCSDWLHALARLRADNWKTEQVLIVLYLNRGRMLSRYDVWTCHRLVFAYKDRTADGPFHTEREPIKICEMRIS